MQPIRIGSFEISRVADFEGPAFDPVEFFPDFDPEIVSKVEPAPEFSLRDPCGPAGSHRGLGPLAPKQRERGPGPRASLRPGFR